MMGEKRSEIRNIKRVCKGGAFGDPDSMGFWIYGKRRDGKNVACMNEVQEDGSIQIWSQYAADAPYLAEDMTEFSSEEWKQIRTAKDTDQKAISNAILDARKN